MNNTETDAFESIYDALIYLGSTSGLYINETLKLPRSDSNWTSILTFLPLILGFIGLIFNILALIIFTSSNTFRRSSFRCYIYTFVLVNCASILTHSWLYLLFYLTDPMRLCKYLQYLQQSSATTSLWIMVLLSLERSFTFKRPFIVKKLSQSRTIYLILLFITCLCFALHIDELVSVDIKAFRWVNFAYGICSVKRNFHLSSDRVKIVTHSHSFILPFLLNSVLDAYICYQICQRRKRLLFNSTALLFNAHSKKKHRRSKKSLAQEITLTLLIQSLWLLFTYFPTHIYYFLISFKLIIGYDRDNSTLHFLMRLNLLIYLAFSPTLYVILSPTLRHEIQSYIHRAYKQHKTRSLPTMSSTHNRVRHFFLRRHPQRINRLLNRTILVTTSEQSPSRILSKSISIPVEIQYLSQSVPCLHIYNNEVEYNGNIKLERSNTLHE